MLVLVLFVALVLFAVVVAVVVIAATIAAVRRDGHGAIARDPAYDSRRPRL